MFYCGYCYKKKDSLARVDGYEAKTAEGWKARPSCPACVRHWDKCTSKHLHIIPMRKKQVKT